MKDIKWKFLQIAEVYWYDAQFWGGWREKENFDPDRQGSQLCRSVGYIFKNDKNTIVLVSSESDQNLADVTEIPKSCVKKVRILK